MRAAICIALGLLLGIGAGRLIFSSPAPPPSADPRLQSGAGVGEIHTREGAALAAARYQQAFATPAILRPGELGRRARALATPAFAPRIERANRPGARRLARGRFGRGLREGVPSAFFATPLAYRVLSYSPARAAIRSWGFTLLANAAGVSPSAYFGLARTVLVWRAGRWQIADTRASFGPTPHLLTPSEGERGLGVVAVANSLHRYGVAP